MTLADILVVMNAGLVEPLDIYEQPAPTFVASFIGAPPMTLLPLSHGPAGPALTDGKTIDFASAKAITLGLRLEEADVIFGAEAPSGAFVLPAIVEVVEPVGAEIFLHCAAGGNRIVVRVGGRATAKPGDHLRVVAKAEKLHRFDGVGIRL